MELPDALTALRSLDLPDPRRRFIAAQLATANDADRKRIVYRARAEAEANQDANRQALDLYWSEREATRRDPSDSIMEMRAGGATVDEIQRVLNVSRDRIYTVLGNAPQRPQETRRAVREPSEYYREVRPVRVRYVTPTKPPVASAVSRRDSASTRINTPKPEPIHREIPHGTLSGYNRWGCRCSECGAVKRASRKPKGIRAPKGSPTVHGTTTGYARGCRDCPGDESGRTCRDAVTEAARAKRARSKS